MNSRTKVRTGRGWDIAVVAAILAVVLLGWLTSVGGGGGAAAPHSGQVVQARLSSRAGTGGEVSGNVSVTPRTAGGNGGAVARGRRTPR